MLWSGGFLRLDRLLKDESLRKTISSPSCSMATDLTLYALLAFFPLLALSKSLFTYFDNQRRLRHIPVVGPSGLFSSYLGGFRYLKSAPHIIHEGYKKYPGRPFRIALLDKWQIIISGPDKIDDIRRASHDYLSIQKELDEAIQGAHTIGWDPEHTNQYHIDVIRGELTRRFASKLPDMHAEIIDAMAEHIPVTQDWTKICIHREVQRIVTRATSRIFVGLPLCRNAKYVDHVLQFAVDVMASGRVIAVFPWFLKPIAARFLTSAPSKLAEAEKFLAPVIQERLDDEAKFGRDRPGRPDDLISWMLNAAPVNEQTVHGLALRVLVTNMASIHTTSNALTSALYRLVEHPELIPILREEIEAAVKTDGFTKAAVNKMHKVDAFFMESQRMAVVSAVGLRRRIMKEFTFSDGTVVPAGFSLGVALWSLHFDGSIYSDPQEFNPFRSPVTEDEAKSVKFRQTMVTPRLDYIPFGHGREICPGRFLASSELKLLLAHMLINYDIKAVDGNACPPPKWFGPTCIPNPKVDLLFRARSKSG
ncbi:cytochrome P450 [Mycena floridula]|nr:cytochrome P450 [Mycena floridula]